MNQFVIDASVAVKLFVDEQGADEAMFVYGTSRLLAPDLLVPECANIFWKKVRRGELLAIEAETAANLLQQCKIELRPTRELIVAATRLSLLIDHPAYDCFYLALAQAEACPLVTADQRLANRVAERKLPIPLQMLSSFEA